MTGRKKKQASRRKSSEPAAAARDRFLRDGGDADALTDLGCPDCRGVLSVDEHGPGGFLSFRCRVGHGFSLESLVPLKEDRLEDALWTAVELCEELTSLYEYLAARTGALESPGVASAHRRTAAKMRRHAEHLRAIVADAGTSTAAAPRRSRT